MPIIVIAIFRPKPGKEDELLGCLRDHKPLMRRLGFITGREPIVMRARGNGEILEIFEWVSEKAIADAHEHPEVRALWDRYEECCTHAALSDLAEANKMFPGFEPITM